ncbi:MAG: methylmalonyl-CoA mutase subunit beta [Rhizobiaceae bacterium]
MDSDVLRTTRLTATDRSGWLALVAKALRGADFDKSLLSHTDDQIRIDPLYERARNVGPAGRIDPRQRWSIVQRADDTDPARANAQALDDIENGATGLAIVFEGAPNAFGYGLPATTEALLRTLEGVPLNKTHLRIDVHPSSRLSVDWLVELLAQRRVDPAKLSLSFGIDPAANFVGTGRLRMSIEALRASMPQSLAHFFAMGVPAVLLEADGRVYHNAGATEAQELGAMLAAAVWHLRMFEEARQPLVYAAPHIGFATSVDQDQFMSIAKIRALRRLWIAAQEACSITPSQASIHAETSFRMLAKRDAETNILRNTIAAFSAGVAGADTISVLPHTLAHGLPDAFARRIARNTQLIIAGESHLDFVADPAAGSGAIESLTGALCEKAWDEFRRIETEGGMLASLSKGHFQERVKAARDERGVKLREGERAILGTTIYPPPKERAVSTLDAEKRPMPEDGSVFCERLPAMRLDQLMGNNA